jgi:hypothetical protein
MLSVGASASTTASRLNTEKIIEQSAYEIVVQEKATLFMLYQKRKNWQPLCTGTSQ